MNKIVQKNQQVIFLTAILIINLIIFLNSRTLFPSSFFLDSQTIKDIMAGYSTVTDGSYYNTASFYSILGFKSTTPDSLIELYSYFIFIVLMFLLIFKFKINLLSIKNFFVFFIFNFVYSCYFTQMGKELVLLSLECVLLTIWKKKNSNNDFIFSLFIIIYAYLFRNYWVLVFLLALVIKLTSKFWGKIFCILSTIVSIVMMHFFYHNLFGEYLTDSRYQANSLRKLGANTILNNPFINTSVFTDFLNFCYSFISLLLPIDGIGSVNEILYYVWIWGIIFIFLNSKIEQKFILSFFISFLIIQGFFEPDIGSVFRHQISLVPMLFICLKSSEFFRGKYENGEG